jgi:hypothetical protein
VLVAKGWTKPGNVKLSSKPWANQKRNISSGTTEKKNWIGKYGKVARCYKCACNHEQDCDCPCTYHLAHQCPNKREKTRETKADLGLFMRTNGPLFSEDDQVTLLVESTLDELCLATGEENNIALVDSACPTTVAGIGWVKNFLDGIPGANRRPTVEISSRTYKFGGGERRKSKGVITLPCLIDDNLEVLRLK